MAGRSLAALAALSLLGVACDNGPSTSGDGRRAAGTPLPRADGPLANTPGLASALPVGALLHDDGRALRAVPLDGRSAEILWTHAQVDTYEIAASPDGRELAIAVRTSPPPFDSRRPSAFLYLVKPGERVRTVDVVDWFGTIGSPRFLRDPSDPLGPVRLYWVRLYDEGADLPRGHPLSEVLVLDGSRRREVHPVLRRDERPFHLGGYAGSPLFSLTLFKRDNLPTRMDVLATADPTFPRDSFTRWAHFNSVVGTDVPTGVAWVAPRDYVLAVAQRAHPEAYELRLYRSGCEYYGTHIFYRGTGIDLSAEEPGWPLLPAGRRHVLALGAKALARVRSGRADDARWLSIDVGTGRVHVTGAQWKPRGWWTFVQRGPATNIFQTPADCGEYRWTAP